MTEIIQRLQSDAIGLGNATAFELRESLDRPYALRLELEDGTPDFDGDAAREKNVVLEYGRPEATSRRIVGMILRVENARRDGEGRAFVEVGPALALLALERTSRIFQEMTVPDILKEVLEEALGRYGRTIDIGLSGTYEPREYCVQWQETTLDFVQRLMAEEGIAYHFDHSGATEVLALRDKNDDYSELSAQNGATVAFTVTDTAGGALIPEAVNSFRMRQKLGRTHVAVRDHDWTGPQMPEGSTGEADEKGRERESFEHSLGLSLSIGSYDEGAKRYQKNDASAQPGIRLEADRARLLVFDGESTIPAMAPGLTFELTDEPSGLDGRYLITDAEVRGRVGEHSVRNLFTCIPIDVAHRPARTTVKPSIVSAEVATVAGPDGEEIHTDPHGRIMVRFPWDRADTPNERASCWMRVSQRWAGNGFGTLHVPRIGMEVIVRYVNGDPDRPLVTGCLYQGDNLPPFPLPDEKAKSTIKSSTSLGGASYNQLYIDDTAGKEQIYLYGKKGCDEEVVLDHTTTIGVDQTNTVHNDQTQTINGDQTENVKAHQTMSVGGARTVTIQANFDEKVDGTEKRKVTSGFKEFIIGGQKRQVKGVVELLSSGEKRMVMAGLTEENNATHARAIIGDAQRTCTGAFTHAASGAVKLVSTGSCITTQAGGLVSANGGPSVKIEAPVIMEFSSSFSEKAPLKTLNASVKVGAFGFCLGAAVSSNSKTGISLTKAGFSYSMTAVSLTATSLSLSKTGSDRTGPALSITVGAIVISKGGAQSLI